MARQDNIRKLLKAAAPLFYEVARHAQKRAAELADTDWAKDHMPREASLNQLIGLSRWRIFCDTLVRRAGELPAGLELTTDDAEQNQGRYYFGAPDEAVVFTVRRKPHKSDERPEALQMRLELVLEMCPVKYDDGAVTVYLVLPPLGLEPRFDVIQKGKERETFLLADLLADDRPDEGAGGAGTPVEPHPRGPRSGGGRTRRKVRSSEDAATETQEDVEGDRS